MGAWPIVAFLLCSELLDAAAIDLELVVAEASLVLRRVLVVRDRGVEVENVFVWRLQLSKQIGDVCIVDTRHLLV